MVDMIICGLSMEMEMAKEAGHIGKCIGCLYFETRNQGGTLSCAKNTGPLKKEKENCKDWVVDHR